MRSNGWSCSVKCRPVRCLRNAMDSPGVKSSSSSGSNLPSVSMRLCREVASMWPLAPCGKAAAISLSDAWSSRSTLSRTTSH